MEITYNAENNAHGGGEEGEIIDNNRRESLFKIIILQNILTEGKKVKKMKAKSLKISEAQHDFKRFLRFCKFDPDNSYKKNSYIKNCVILLKPQV